MTSTTDIGADHVPPPSRERPSPWAALRPLVLRLHFYAGVLVAPFLLVAAATGLLYALSFQIERVVYGHELTTTSTGPARPLSDQVAAARAAQPGGTVTAVRTPGEPGETTKVLMNRPGLPESTQLAVFVDPHTAEVRGTLESYGSSGALPVRAWISQLHRHLHLGEPGRIYSELAASWLWVVALGGLTLWVVRRRRARRHLVLPERSAGGMRRTLSWHGSVGTWAVLGLLFLSATGLTWSKYAGENVSDLRTALNWSTPSISVSGGDHGGHGGAGAHHAGAGNVGVDQVVRAAAGKGLSGPLEVSWPGAAGEPYLVKEIDKTAPTRLDQVAVDATSGQVTSELRFADYSLAAKLARWGIDGHMGLLFGLVNQVVLAFLAAGLIALIVLGYRMWWRRRPTKGFGKPYARGGWRKVPLFVLVPLGLVTVGVGVFLPLMGISLAAFLVIDILLGVRARRSIAQR